jgi:hypothetical protein
VIGVRRHLREPAIVKELLDTGRTRYIERPVCSKITPSPDRVRGYVLVTAEVDEVDDLVRISVGSQGVVAIGLRR